MTSSFIRRTEIYPGYWDYSETCAVRRLCDRLARILPERGSVHALDAGCGRGRALPWIASLARIITALDADNERLAEAMSLKSLKNTTIHFKHSTIAEMDGGPYNLLVCNHVIQHVSVDMVQLILDTFTKVAAADAVAVFSFSRSPIGEEAYGVAYTVDGRLRFRRLDQVGFDSLSTSNRSNDHLPVRMIDPEVFVAQAAKSGWQPCWCWTYHVLRRDNSCETNQDYDDALNASPERRSSSKGDMIVVLERASQD